MHGAEFKTVSDVSYQLSSPTGIMDNTKLYLEEHAWSIATEEAYPSLCVQSFYWGLFTRHG